MSNPNTTTWADHAADRSPSVQRSRARSVQQAQAITRAAHRLVQQKGSTFTTQELTRESGVALQTIYRHFPSKDHILLALVEEIIAEQALRMRASAHELPDPVARLRFYITRTLDGLRGDGDRTGPQFITAEHWRLHQLFPDEMARIAQPFGDLVAVELREAAARGLLGSRDPEHDAWFAMKLVTSVYHHYAFATAREPVEEVARRLWSFCLAAFDGPAEDTVERREA
ncbi:TetR/AcrR family transcriptional regulator [Streptomyces sp. NBC_01016]|uniref:TetR/AcrR family transcriptional regulator n=1 Tax=Streptomyces sp. NBC_01016 TaxID=2903720 RepID=UPI002250D7F2|nr:TetR/AcrR family transcriptional regulator [Streptomyces sp. NBC_01016]MCX4831230.1 TetR/AcrR family transcriptional regulator [Streptomyces sp. NBC_01016]